VNGIFQTFRVSKNVEKKNENVKLNYILKIRNQFLVLKSEDYGGFYQLLIPQQVFFENNTIYILSRSIILID
jgi:hypothetical protein